MSMSDHAKVVIGIGAVAMAKHKIVTLTYKGEPRYVEIHAMGLSKANSPVLRGFDVEAKGWRLFSVDKIEDIGQSDIPSFAPRTLEGYVPGDKGMIEIFHEVTV